MEPCLFRHGKQDRYQDALDAASALQWSHVFSDMVRTDADRRIVKVEQLQWSHVFSDMVRE